MESLRIRYLGALLLLGLLIGGSSVNGLWTTMVVELAVVPLVVIAAGDGEPVDRSAVLLLVLTSLVIVLQMVPFGLAGPRPTEWVPVPSLAWSRDIGRTLDEGLFFLCGATVFIAANRLTEDQLKGIVPYFLMGVTLNIVIAFIQFAASHGVGTLILPYEAAAGVFANQNHFTSLMLVAIPFVVYSFERRRRPLLALPVIAVIVFITFAAGSVAGSFLSLGCTATSYALVSRLGRGTKILLLVGSIAGAIVLLANPGNVLQVRSGDPLDRTVIWTTTVQLVAHYLPWGAGFGTFPIVYPGVEPAENVMPLFINRAHDEYLEFVVGGGIPAALLMLGYAVLLARAVARCWGRPFAMAATAAIGFLLLHSLVDYPLRSIGLGLVFAWLNALVVVSARDGGPGNARLEEAPLRQTELADAF